MRSKRRNEARRILNEIDNNLAGYFTIHYSCESFYGNKLARSPRITSIALHNLGSDSAVSFSIHKSAEKARVAESDIQANYDSLEKTMLAEYFSFLQRHETCKFVHWHMRDINYGFQAIEHRYEVLTGKKPSVIVTDERKINLARILQQIYGVEFTGKPQLTTLLEKNDITPRNFLGGKEEATAFDNGEYIKLHQSTLSKVRVFAEIIELAVDNKLKTDAKWHNVYGVSISGFWQFLQSEWYGAAGLAILSAIIGALISLGIDWLLKK